MRIRALTGALTGAVAAAAAAALVLTACGGDGTTGGSSDTGGSQSSSSTDQQDHNQAQRIEAAQGPEIETMTGWLEDWGAEVPETGMGGMNHGGDMSTGRSGMQGMMSPEQMQQLEQASGTEFDQLFLTMMIEHHEGAVAMARTEVGNGQNTDAVELAGQITDTQQAEISEMQALLQRG